MTREEALNKAINIVMYFEAHFAKSKEAREEMANIIEALEQEPCEDCISRQAVIDLVNSDWKYEGLETDVASLPSVNPQKIGHWITLKDEYGDIHEAVCSKCDSNGNHKWKFCTTCGCRMVESPESEVEHE